LKFDKNSPVKEMLLATMWPIIRFIKIRKCETGLNRLVNHHEMCITNAMIA
jgi:hypothetical protein